MSWNSIAQAIAPVVAYVKSIFKNPDVQVMIVIRNKKTGDQFEAGDVPNAEMPAWLRQAANTIEADKGKEPIKGVAVVKPDSTDILIDKSKKEH